MRFSTQCFDFIAHAARVPGINLGYECAFLVEKVKRISINTQRTSWYQRLLFIVLTRKEKVGLALQYLPYIFEHVSTRERRKLRGTQFSKKIGYRMS